MQDLDKIAKMDIKDEPMDILDPEDRRKRVNEQVLSEKLVGEEFIRQKQRGSIITGRKTSIFLMPAEPMRATLGAFTLELRRKSLGIVDEIPEDEPFMLPPEMDEVDELEVEIRPIKVFTPLEAVAVSCILEECLEQLATVGFIIPANVDPRWDETFKTIDETYGIPDEAKTIFREEMGLLPLVPTAAEKMQRDRNYVSKVLERVLRDIRDNRRFDSLQEEVDQIIKKQNDERKLEAIAQIWLNKIKTVQEVYNFNKKMNEIDEENTINLAQDSDVQVDHATFLNNGKLDYAERWSKARMEQEEFKLQLQRTDILAELEELSKEYNAEQIISAEISAYLETDIEDKENQIAEWTAKYNEELVQRQQEIDELKEEVEKQKVEVEELRFTRDNQVELINEYTNNIKILQKELAYRTKLNKAAILIQAIWRGYMVRHELGKFKNLRKRMKKRKKVKDKKKKARKPRR